MTREQPLITIVGPVFNEEECIVEFHQKLAEIIDPLAYRFEILFVDDGSSDRTPEILNHCCIKDERVKVLSFSRNFGHQIAIKAGIDHADGEAVILMDTDLQDPPGVIVDMIRKWEEGFDVVYAVRAARKGESFLKVLTANIYYRLMKSISNIDIPLDAGDFRLISRKVVDTLKGIHEKRPYLRGLVSWVGFKQTGVLMKREARYAGKTKFTWLKMIRFAWSGIVHFSFLPLQLATIAGSLTAVGSFIWFLNIMYATFVLKITVPGWSSIMVAVLLLGSIQLITLGILGSYLAKTYDESRGRPLYIIQGKEGFASDDPIARPSTAASRPREGVS